MSRFYTLLCLFTLVVQSHFLAAQSFGREMDASLKNGSIAQDVHIVCLENNELTGKFLALDELVKAQELNFESKAKAILQRFILGTVENPSIFHEDTKIATITVAEPNIQVYLTMDPNWLEIVSDDEIEDLYQYMGFALDGLNATYYYEIFVNGNRTLSSYRTQAVIVNKPEEKAVKSAKNYPAVSQSPATGALSGKSIFLSPGHGWYYSTNVSRWATQRGNSYNLIEDHSNAEACFNWLVPYLTNAGAQVYTCRERDMNRNMVIVDNQDSNCQKTGSWTTQTSTSAYSGDQIVSQVSATQSASARFTPNIPASGYYGVYVYYRPHTSGSVSTSTAAKYKINHTGGTTEWVQNQTRDGYTWKYVGKYYFEAGSSSANGSVELINQGSETSKYVVADAVRFGGGMGDQVYSSTTSNKPRWEESGKLYAPFMGGADNGTVSSMPIYAAYENESWEDSVYVSWHTNAGGGTGTETYHAGTSGVSGSEDLCTYVHNEIINDVRAGWDSSWYNRGVKTAGFGEISSSNNSEMPATLTEIGFHDKSTDAVKLKSPRFRQLCARAVYQGVVKYFANRDGQVVKLLPEAPRNVFVEQDENMKMIVRWTPPLYNTGDHLYGDPATGYRVYLSKDGKGFDNGRTTTATSYTFSNSELSEGEVYYVRITATNAGGESFPTRVIAMRRFSKRKNKILLVQGFNRLDTSMMIVEDDPYDTDDLAREYLDQMNREDYISYYAEAIGDGAMNEGFDTTTMEAVDNYLIALADYHVVCWMGALQQEVTTDDPFDASALSSNIKNQVEGLLNQKGALFLSGANILKEFSSSYSSFSSSTLKVSSVSTGNASALTPSESGIFSGIESISMGSNSLMYPTLSVNSMTTDQANQSLFFSSSSGSTIMDFDSSTGWWDPNDSGQTDAADASSFSIASSPVQEGSGSGDLYYVWDSGSIIRLYCTLRPEVSTSQIFSVWVYGDNSGHQVAFNLRDTDSDFFRNDYVTIDFTGWRKISWDVSADPYTIWYTGGNGTIDGPVYFDSFFLNKVGSQNSGHIYFDNMTTESAATGTGPVAAVQYRDDYSLVLLGFPFESVDSSADRTDMMNRVLNFFSSTDASDWALYR